MSFVDCDDCRRQAIAKLIVKCVAANIITEAGGTWLLETL